jgi:hypothetical protein
MKKNLLKEKKLPKQYWVEAMSCVVYLLNHCPTRNLQAVTPEEAWCGHNHVLLIFESLVVWPMQRS